MFLHTWAPPPIVFSVGPFELRWYGILLALGALAGLWLLRRLGRRQGFSDTILIDLFVWLTVTGFLGGRIYHVLNELPYYLQHPTQIFMVWEGGLGIHGAIIAGLMVLVFFARKNRLDTWRLLDILTPALVLGQIIGRWGNYFNQELYGRTTSLPWGIPIAGQPGYYHPTFLYESVGNTLILTVLLWLGKKRNFPVGTVALVYFILYAILRIFTESFRIDQTPIIAGIRLPILVSGVMILTALILLIQKLRHGTPTPQTPPR